MLQEQRQMYHNEHGNIDREWILVFLTVYFFIPPYPNNFLHLSIFTKIPKPNTFTVQPRSSSNSFDMKFPPKKQIFFANLQDMCDPKPPGSNTVGKRKLIRRSAAATRTVTCVGLAPLAVLGERSPMLSASIL